MRTTLLKSLLTPLAIAAPVIVSSLTGCLNGGRPECPHDWDFGLIQVRDSGSKQPKSVLTLHTGTLSASGAQTNVPEFNDCQRLIRGTGSNARYDSLYAVFAWDSMDVDTVGARAAIEADSALPMAEVLSIGGTYEFLGIRPGLSCLFVYRVGDAWRASLVAFGSVERDCHKPVPIASWASLHHTDLAVTRTSYHDLRWSDYPAAARWEWDVKTNKQVIGFKCLDGWCEAGEHPPDTGPDLTARLSLVSGLAGSPVLRIKGWYDEQRLAPAKPHWWSSGLGPRQVVGTVIPIPGLGALNENSDFNPPHWHLIEYVDLSEPSGEYYAAERFSPMILPGQMTRIFLCREQWHGIKPLPGDQLCPDITDALRTTAKCAPEFVSGTVTNHWWAKTVPANGENPRYWCIVRRYIKGVPVPGTARWRWLAGDETTWGRCGSGCCTGH